MGFWQALLELVWDYRTPFVVLAYVIVRLLVTRAKLVERYHMRTANTLLFGHSVALLVAASLLTATVVSVAGGIGFVGLIVPHAVRLVVGPDHRKVLPVSLLTGAVFLVLVDLVTRTVDKPNEMPIGIFTAALGAPFFLMLLNNRKKVWR